MDKQLMLRRVHLPDCCPFCGKLCLKLRFFEEQYFDAEKRLLVERVNDDGVQVFCGECKEEIREEDVIDGTE